MLSFLPGHHEDMFFSIFLVLKKNVLDRWSSDQLCMPGVQCLRRAGGFWQFVEHLLRIEQNRLDSLVCDEELWCLSGLILQREAESSTASPRSATSP